MGSEEDVGLEHPTVEGSNAGVRTKRLSGGGAGYGGGGRGTSRRDVDRRSRKEDSGKGEG